jgi:hypothetical protein
MKQINLVVFLTLLTIFGCFNKNVEEPKFLSRHGLQALILSAINGNKKANDSLSVLIDLEVAENNDYNSIEVDSFYLDSMKYFSVLLEYPNPIYNRFAVYDSLANCFLIDKSLNGSLSFEVIELQDLTFLKVIERFISKDTLSLSRLSFYKIINKSINLVYRSFAELKTLKKHFYQTINFISEDSIKTQILVPKKYKLNVKEDVFVFDSIHKEYRSNQSLFDKLVYKEIADFDFEILKPQI